MPKKEGKKYTDLPEDVTPQCIVIVLQAAILVVPHSPMASLLISVTWKPGSSKLAFHWLRFAASKMFAKIFSSQNYLPVDIPRKKVSRKIDERPLYINM